MSANIDIGCFVTAQSNKLGAGKVVAIIDSISVLVEYFYSVTKQKTLMLKINDLRRGIIRPKTRCYFKDQEYWQSGIICDIKKSPKETIYKVKKIDNQNIYLPESKIYIRCREAISNPLDLLSLKVHDTGFNHVRRSDFIRSLLEQRAVARGMTGLISSKIMIFPHQIEVVRRVLENPIQRYLLADEVGLGKTIEAGAIIRQYLIDNPKGSVLVFVPPLLIRQWHKELFERFRIGDFSSRVRLLSVNDIIKFKGRHKYGLVVIDEAHHVAQLAFSRWADEQKWFNAAAALAQRAERLLLLSATPVLNNEHNFLAMLNLLDPDMYKLSDIDKFIHVVEKRQEIGQLLLGFKEGKGVFIIKKGIEKIRQMFPDDHILGALLMNLENKLPSEEYQAECAQIIRAIRVHITETYRLHQRIMRNRRENVDGLIGRYHRDGQSNQLICQYDEDSLSEHIHDLLNEWRESALRSLHRKYDVFDKKGKLEFYQIIKIFFVLLESSIAWPGHFRNVLTCRLRGTFIIELEEDLEDEAYHLLREVPLFEGEKELLEKMLQMVNNQVSEWDRIRNLEILLDVNKNINLNLGKCLQKCVIFTNYTSSCRQIVNRLIKSFGRGAVSKYHRGISQEVIEWEVFRFRSDPECFIFVCDWSGEEGRNFQFADVIIHFDLPWAPNRIEQRIGRLDRIGRNKALCTYVFAGPKCANSLYEAWFKALDEGFDIFKNSIASLQFFVDEKMPMIHRLAFMKGAGGILDAIESIQEDIKQEKVKIYEQYALDEINAIEKFDTDYFDTLQKVDHNYVKMQQKIEPWLCDVLGLEKEQGGFHGEIVQYRHGSRTLVPETVLSKLDPYLSKPGTYSREVAESITECDLYRIGHLFLNIIEKYTILDDRGKTFIIWRYDKNWQRAEWAGFRFDYIIEADTRPVEKIFEASATNLKALRNRAEAFFQPKYKTIYVDIELNKAEDAALLNVLGRPFKGKVEGGNDYDLIGDRLHLLDEFVDQGCWPDLCQDALKASESFLRDTSFIMECVKAGDKAAKELEARVERLRIRKSRDTEIEQKIAGALVKGIRTPMIRLDSVGFIILSGREPL